MTSGGGEAVVVVYPDEHLEPFFSQVWLLAALVCMGVVVVKAMRAWSAERRLLALAQAKDRAAGPRAEGETVLHGKVVLADGEDLAIRKVITQQGSEQKRKKSWSYSWRETKRETEAVPFYIECSDGQRVRVEPDQRTIVLVPASRPEWVGPRLRSLTFEISAGDTIFVEGILRKAIDPQGVEGGGAYRGDARGWVVRHLEHARLRLSRTGFSPHHKYKLSRMARANLLALACLCGSFLISAPYLMSLVRGEGTTGTVLRSYKTKVRSKHGYRTRHMIVYRVQDNASKVPRSLHGAVDSSDLEDVGPNVRVAVRRFRGFSGYRWQLGRGASNHWGVVFFQFCFIFGAFSLVESSVQIRRWLNEKLNHHGSGRLVEPLRPRESAKRSES